MQRRSSALMPETVNNSSSWSTTRISLASSNPSRRPDSAPSLGQTAERICEQISRITAAQMLGELYRVLSLGDQFGQADTLVVARPASALAPSRGKRRRLRSPGRNTARRRNCHATDSLRLHQAGHDAGLHQRRFA